MESTNQPHPPSAVGKRPLKLKKGIKRSLPPPTTMIGHLEPTRLLAKPRRLCVPSDNDDDEDLDANPQRNNTYQWDNQEFMNSILFPALNARPLPSIVSILAVAPQRRTMKPKAGAGASTWKQSSDSKHEKEAEMQRDRQLQASLRTGKEMPLLRDFFAKLEELGEGTSPVEDTVNANEAAEKEDTVVEEQDVNKCAIDVHSTILTAGHHKRYRELLSELSTACSILPTTSNRNFIKKLFSNPTKYKEFETLSALFEQERGLYRTALEVVRQDLASRFRLGFVQNKDANGTCRANFFVGTMTEMYQEQQRLYETQQDGSGGLPRYYGKCCQLHSLQEFSLQFSSSSSSSSLGPKGQVDVNAFSSKIIQVESKFKTSNPKPLPADWSERLMGPNFIIRPIPPTTDWKPYPTKHLLQTDNVAIQLAQTHKVDVILSSSTLLTLLQRPGHALTQWMLPIASVEIELNNQKASSSKSKMTHVKTTTSTRSVVVIEDPVLHPVTPRERLEVGFERALVWNLLESRGDISKEENGGSGEQDDGSIQYVYTLLTLPSSTATSPSHESCTLLVRSENEIFDADHNPIHMLPQLEYFPERGMEECSTLDRARWLLLKMIQPKCRVCVVRIDPEKAKILRMEEKSMAHALTESMDGGDRRWDLGLKESLVVMRGRDDGDLTAHLRAMMVVLKGMKTVERGQKHLLCLPGRGDVALAETTVSFHKAVMKKEDVDNIEDAHASTNRSPSLVVDLHKELQAAECVFLAQTSLLNCFRLWEWNHDDREPFCFPNCDKKSISYKLVT